MFAQQAPLLATSDVEPGLNEDFLETTLSDVSEDIREILLDQAILHRIKTALDQRIIGEDRNKLLLFLIGLTSHMDKVLGAIILGESSAGKSYLMNNVLKFFTNVEEYTRITRAAPDRTRTHDFRCKILKIGELRGADAAQATLRVLISEGKLRLWTTKRDDDGEIVDEVIETIGFPALFTTSTNLKPDEELLNRLFLVSIDETERQTEKVLQYEAQEFMDPFEEENYPPKELVEAIGHITTTPFHQVLIPFADQLAKRFPTTSVKVRRDFKKLLCIISAVAFLHQFQRPIVYRNKLTQYIVALPVDFHIAWEICEQGLRQTLMNVQKRSLEVLELYKDPNTEILTSRQVADKTGLSQTRAREINNSLVNSGFLLKDIRKKEHSFSIKKKNAIDSTIDNFVTSAVSFNEKQFAEWLINRNFKTRYRTWESEYTNPLTGETIHTSSSRVLTKTETEHNTISCSEKNHFEGTKTSIVASSTPSVTIQEAIETLIPQMPVFTETIFLEKTKELGFTRDNAELLFQHVKNEELIGLDPQGYWQWTRK